MAVQKQNKKPELIAPAGSWEKMATAFAFGADAVYLGVPDYSLRSRINSITAKDIRSACKYAHGLGKKVFATVNIIAHEKDFAGLPAHIRLLRAAQADGVIVSDPGVIKLIRECWPEAKIHLSTQANCLNSQAALFWQAQGVKRVVLGRETELNDIKKIKKAAPELELEYFVHGAMCMAYSGRCFLSKLVAGRSANAGDCIQPCRWGYEMKFENGNLKLGKDVLWADVKECKTGQVFAIEEDGRGSYIFNTKDLCLIEHLDKLAAAGVDAFKIEGRTKSVYYVAAVAGAYRRAVVLMGAGNKKTARVEIAGIKADLEEKLYNRGFTEGFLLGQGGWEQSTDASHYLPKWEFCGQVMRNADMRIRANDANNALDSACGSVFIKVHNTIKSGSEVEIVCPGYDIIKLKMPEMMDVGTGDIINEAHGGREQVVMVDIGREVPEYSVLRRRKT